MHVASVAITFNDGFKFREWVDHYNLYKDELYMNIIVDNGSDQEYLELVENSFSGTHIIKRQTNGGCTGAYNDGIRFALSDPDVDAIMLIGNDIRLEKGGVTKLYNFLYSNVQFGMVGPVVLKKDSNLVEIFGGKINPRTLTFDHLYVNTPVSDVHESTVLSDSLPGGMNMAKRSFYEVVGLQDEYLFMYSDEIDTGIRARKHNMLMVATKDVLSWHQHINPGKAVVRSPLAGFLWGRNEVYLAKKHFHSDVVRTNILFRLKRAFITNANAWLKWKTFDEKRFWWYYMLGTLAGIFNVSKMPSSRS
ncbi:MAG TPA: glycosyltransferase [Bacteroidales bacterium]|nr:glycosyltransferase [Bacteroidales bacterium]